MKSYDQYLLQDPQPLHIPYRGFATGLITFNGDDKPTHAAYELPIYMPQTSGPKGAKFEVWGGGASRQDERQDQAPGGPDPVQALVWRYLGSVSRA